MARPESSLLPRDSLLESGRTSRLRLREWARELLDGLEQRSTTAVAQSGIGGCMNNAALIELYRGDCHSAKSLCTLQLQWAEGLLRADDPLASGHLFVLPWVNLGRILRIQGRFEHALEHFSLLRDTLEGGPMRIGRLTLDAPTWLKLVESGSLLPVLKAIYIVDSVKTYFAARDFAGAAAFLARARTLLGDVGAEFPMLDEVELITLSGLGRHEAALSITQRPGWQQSHYAKLVRFTYRVALAALSGAMNEARRMAEQLAERVLESDWSRASDQRLLRYLYYLGQLLAHLELREAAARVHHQGLKASHHFVDVPLRLSFLECLLALDTGAERERLASERQELLGSCLYVTLLEPRGLEVNPVAAADPVFAQLRNALTSIASASATWERHTPGEGVKGLELATPP